MIQTTSPNAKMTLENLQSLAEYEGRLSVLNGEIAVAQKGLNVVRKEIDKAIKEKDYQDQLLDGLTSEAQAKKAEVTKLDSEIEQKDKELGILIEKVKEITLGHESKTAELKNREEVILNTEREHVTLKEVLQNRKDKLETSEKEHAIKVNLLKEVLTKI